ncbi:cytochrome P450 98A3 [Ephemerocybe angulata]|uniref:Cytochrome P450 98A3 n=1 Tax=Ephemerocybe angulata TaxID=980116 RepID=A0A8H6LZU6_9AGAR|nr:cytochrome P450 98A3 [Tulosesus angulatus]
MHPAALVAAGGFVWAVKNIAENKKKNPRGLPLPPGPHGLPLLGNLFQLPQSEQWKAYQAMAKEYGDMVYLEAMGQPIIILGTLERTEDLMEKHATMYSDRPTLPVGQFIDLSHSFAMMNYGAEWRHDRRVFHQYLNHNAVVQYHPIMEQEAITLLRRLSEKPDDFRNHVRFTLGSIIMRVAYGFDDAEANKRLVSDAEQLVSTFTDAIVPGRYLFNSFPVLGNIPDWFPGAGFKQKFRELNDMNEHMLSSPFESAKKNLSEGVRSAYPNMATDLIDKLQEESTPSWIGKESVARNVCGLAYLTGADTTVSSAWALVFALATHPEVQEKAREEIDLVIGNDRLPQLSDRESLPYISAIVKEVSRWHSVVPLGLSRASAEDSEYNGYFIPKGTYIMMNTWAFMHDPEVFEKPMDFIPERYLKDGKINPNVRDPEAGAFGYGRRICPGRHLSNDAIFLLAASLLAVYHITPPKDDSGVPIPMSFAPSSDVVSTPLPYQCEFTPRSSKHMALFQ